MLKIHAKNLENVAVLSLEGKVVNGETEVLRTAARGVSSTRAIILDLAQVRTVDAHGLGVMLELREQAISRGLRFKVINVNQPLNQIFEITRLDSVFEMNSRIEYFPTVMREQRAA
ncbi:MAG TPA: STAS domain-containing protein [Pyrinomonadaceae bacterium]